MTFYERIENLCQEKGIKPQSKEFMSVAGVSSGTITNWKQKGAEPEKISTYSKIADYFGVTSDYLLGLTDERTAPTEELEGVDFALSGELKGLTENEKQDLLDYIRFKKQQREAK